jgi:hypothetical protein
MMMCIKLPAKEVQPPNMIVSWQDGDDQFYLLPQDHTLHTASTEGDSAIDRIQECGTGGSLWRNGNESICKVKGCCQGRQLESSTINFVRDNYPDVPMPEVIYSWTDELLNRTFLILKRVHARTLDNAWRTLSANQRCNIATEIAQHCFVLAANTSSRYETVSGSGVLEYCLMGPLLRPIQLGCL